MPSEPVKKLQLPTFSRLIYDELRSAPPGIWAEVSGADQTDATAMITGLCDIKKYPMFLWTPSIGVWANELTIGKYGFAVPENGQRPDVLIKFLRKLTLEEYPSKYVQAEQDASEPMFLVLVLQMADRILREDSSPELLDAFAKLSDLGPGRGLVTVYLSKSAKYPTDFLGRFISVHWPSPSQDDVINIVRPLVSDGELDETEDGLQAVYAACRGMPSEFVKTTVSRSIRRHRKVLPSFLAQEKASMLASQLGITIKQPEISFQDLGGLQGAKTQIARSLRTARLADWIVHEADKPSPDPERMKKACDELSAGRGEWASTEEEAIQLARTMTKYPPRGVLLYGVEGSGKSALAEATAGEFGIPMIALQVSDFLNKFVGSSEESFRAILRFVDQVAPCIFFIDEVEKLFAGAKNPNGSGVEAHIQGQFLSWAQDQRSGAYVMMTCNDVQIFVDSPELIRSGRCDATYFFDVPTTEELAQIWEIYRRKFDVPDCYITPQSEGWTGANIVDCCRRALEAGVDLETASQFIRSPQSNEVSLNKKRGTAKAQQYLAASYEGIYTGPSQSRVGSGGTRRRMSRSKE